MCQHTYMHWCEESRKKPHDIITLGIQIFSKILEYIFLPSQTIDAIGLHPYKMHTNVPHHLVLKGFFWQSHSLCNFSSYGQSYVIGSNIIIYWIPTGPLASIHYLGTREPITYFPTKFKTSYLECTLISDILYKVCTFCICHYFW